MKKKNNYGDLPLEYCKKDNSKIVMIPVPCDRTSTWIKGADKGPDAILEASANLELYDIETDSEVYKKGIYTEEPVLALPSPEAMAEAVRSKVQENLQKGKFVAVIGGEHSVSIGAIKAHADKHKDICVLQLDAHSDLRDAYQGTKHSHACVMARAKEICPIIQVGIRSMDSSEIKNMNRKRAFFAEGMQKNKEWINKVLKLLSKNVYLTIDLDVFDPSVMPSTGTPEPGGLLWYETLELIRGVTRERNLVGFDVVELCPNPYNKAPDFMAAKLIYKIISYKFEGTKNE